MITVPELELSSSDEPLPLPLVPHLDQTLTHFLKHNEPTIDLGMPNPTIKNSQDYPEQPVPSSAYCVKLSPRELAIAHLVSQGLPNKTIGKHLSISQWTVATYLRRMFIKLGVNSRAAMVARLMTINVLEDPDA
jgi:two-component system, NarL family, nitrate/nitrite response regulator NarL